MSEYRFRPATHADRVALSDLVRDVLAEYGLEFDPDGIDSDQKDIESSYHLRGGSFEVLLDGAGAVVGSVALFRLTPSTCELRKMYFLALLAGRAMAAACSITPLARAAPLGFSRITLKTATVLREAVPLFERTGFRPYAPEHLTSRCNLAYFLDLPSANESA